MASKNLVLKDATWNGVESVDFQVSGGGTARYIETSDATAVAADIALNKTAYVNGSLVTGTNQGGGGGAVKIGALRHDAELVQTWSYDKLFVADGEGTIPAFSTSSKTLKAYSTLTPTITLDPSTYNYCIVGRYLTYPIYNNTSKAKGRQEYYTVANGYELTQFPIGTFDSMDKSKSNTTAYAYTPQSITAQNVLLYWNSATELNITSSSGYGAYMSPYSPTVSNGVLTVYSPNIYIRGNATYLSSTYWGYMTDIRFQWIIELYRVPISASVKGWERLSQLYHVRDCVNDASHTLT